MKKIFISSTLALLFGTTMVMGQVRTNTNVAQNTITGSSAFLDASSSTVWNGSVNNGKGLVFPRVNLVALTQLVATPNGIPNAFPTRMDGMVVYNNAQGTPGIGASKTPNVKPGFYYYKNTSSNLQGGHWVRIADISDVEAGVANGDFWSLNGNANTTTVTIDDMEDATNANVENRNYAFDPTDKNFIGTTDDKNVMFATGETRGSEVKTVARLAIGKIPKRTVGSKKFDFVMEVYGKAHFDQGIVTEASTYPDYVFDNYFTGTSEENPNYEFKKLDEVEKFIKENNHLPGVTSIKELNKSEKGYSIDNTKLSIQTLEKVEELYLHLIEQQKEIQALKAQIAELKK